MTSSPTSTGRAPNRPPLKPGARALYLVAAGCSVVGGLLGLLTVAVASGAPQEAAGAALACASAVVPYVLARAVDELSRE